MSLKVQIPYRGNIPIIHKRGPIACIELELEVCKELLMMGIELLDPFTGKPLPIDAVEEPAEEVAADELAENETSETPAEEKTAETPAEEEKVADPEPEKIDEPETEKVAEPEAKADEAADADAPVFDGSAPAFDFNKVENYTNLSKGKKRELRAFYANNVRKIAQDALYEKLNEMAKETDVAK